VSISRQANPHTGTDAANDPALMALRCVGSHPESNGQVERANAEILKGLKTRTYDGLKSMAASGLMSFRVHYGQSDITQSSHRRDAFLHGVRG
jgi:hypothetical protein